MRKTHTKRENIIFQEIEAKNEICSTNHKYITRGGSKCFPTSWVKLQMCRKCKTLGYEAPKPKCLISTKNHGKPDSNWRVERENGLGSWSGWVRRESFELGGVVNGGEEREREPIGWRGRWEWNVFNFANLPPHTTNIISLLHYTPKCDLCI